MHVRKISLLILFPNLQLNVDLWGPQEEWTLAMIRSRLLSSYFEGLTADSGSLVRECTTGRQEVA